MHRHLEAIPGRFPPFQPSLDWMPPGRRCLVRQIAVAMAESIVDASVRRVLRSLHRGGARLRWTWDHAQRHFRHGSLR